MTVTIRNVMTAVVMMSVIAACSLNQGSSSRIDAAVANPERTDADRERDARDQPGAILALLDLEEGDRVADMFAGGGYYSELLAGVVGARGEVILHNNRGYAKWVDNYLQERYIDNEVPPIRVLFSEVDDLGLPAGSLDAAIMVMSYHDLYYVNPERGFPGADTADYFSQLSAALGPRGKLLIIDHAAPEGSGKSAVQENHRIDPDFARQDIENNGFALIGTSDVLRRPDDPRTDNVFAKKIRGKTDRFVMLFQKAN